jgi:hypothetical protein
MVAPGIFARTALTGRLKIMWSSAKHPASVTCVTSAKLGGGKETAGRRGPQSISTLPIAEIAEPMFSVNTTQILSWNSSSSKSRVPR